MNLSRLMWTAVLILVFFTLIVTAAERKQYNATIDPDGVQRIEIFGDSYFFDPNDIVVRVNVPVEMKIRQASGIIPHSFVLHAPEAGMDIRLDLTAEPQTVRFTPIRTGEYAFYCDKKFLFFESHRDKGMTGILVVKP